MSDKPSVKRYQQAAGGWGAVTSTAKHLLKSENAARNIRTLLKTNQHSGFDCPGCAWGDQQEPGMIRFCENGAKAVNWEATSRRVTAEFMSSHTVSWLEQQSDYFLEYQGRLAEPMRYDSQTDCYQPISWEQAFALIARHLKALDSPDQAEFYTSGRASNEAAFLYQLMVRAYGTNNFPDCSNMCHEASGVALGQSIGVGKGTVTLDDFQLADAIFVFGQNPGTNHPRMLDALRDAAKRGCEIVGFNPLKERGLERFTHPQDPVEMITQGETKISSRYFCPKLGGDMAALRGIAKALLMMERNAQAAGEQPVFDHLFLQQHTQGLEEWLEKVDQASWPSLEEQSGLTRVEMEQAALVYVQADKVIFTWAMGITQHLHSVSTIRELVNVLLLRGNIGKPGAGACPVRGHSNVQGDRTVGINEKPAEAFLDSLESVFNFEVPRENGHNTVAAIQAMLSGKSRVFIALGGNFVAAAPDTEQTRKALKNCDLTVQISTKLNRSHLATGKDALILPCLGRTEIDRQQAGEQMVTVEDSMSMVHSSAGVLEPATDQLRSESAIVAGIANTLLGNYPVNWLELVEDYGRIRELIAATIPAFKDFNQRLAAPGGFYLGNSARDRQWQSMNGKAQFSNRDLPESLYRLPKGHPADQPVLVLQTLRSHDQYNTTVYDLNDRYRGVKGMRKVLFIHPDDIQQWGFANGDRVDLVSLAEDGKERMVSGFQLVAYDTPPGNVAAYYPETNPLIALENVGEQSFTPASKSVPVLLRRSSTDDQLL